MNSKNKHPKILIADDDADWRERIEETLEGEGYEFQFVSTHKEAMKTLGGDISFDLISINVILRGDLTHGGVMLDWTNLMEKANRKKLRMIIITSPNTVLPKDTIYNEAKNYGIKGDEVFFKDDLVRDKLVKKVREIVSAQKISSPQGTNSSVPPPSTPISINITGGSFGVLNVGKIVGNVKTNIESLASVNGQIAEAFRNVIDVIETNVDNHEEKRKILQKIELLTEQANLSPDLRNKDRIKKAFRSLSTSLNAIGSIASIWGQWGKQISSFFGF